MYSYTVETGYIVGFCPKEKLLYGIYMWIYFIADQNFLSRATL